MRTELKKAIIAYIFENKLDFQLHNATNYKFKNYIYDDKGEYLIGGEDVSKFIDNAIKLLN